MFRISHVIGLNREIDRRELEAVRRMLETAFPHMADEPDYLARKLASGAGQGRPCILLVAHGEDDRVLGFAMADVFEALGFAYLDFIVTEARGRGQGVGGALYEALREDLKARGVKGLFLEAPTDDPKQVSNPDEMKANKARLKFYERYGARPLLGTLYDQPIRPGRPNEPRLLYDPLDHPGSLRAETVRKVIRAILTVRYDYAADDPYVRESFARWTRSRCASANRSTSGLNSRRRTVPGGSIR